MNEMTATQREEIMNALQAGKKLEAIRLYREVTGNDLLTAKQFIETLEQALQTGEVPEMNSETGATTVASVDSEQIVQLLRDGKKIEAVKVYRAATGASLKVAKEYVEAMAAERGIESKSGCGLAILCVGVVVCATLWIQSIA